MISTQNSFEASTIDVHSKRRYVPRYAIMHTNEQTHVPSVGNLGKRQPSTQSDVNKVVVN